MNENHIKVFEKFPRVRGFFSYKKAAVEDSPYNNYELFRQLGLDKTMVIWPQQVHDDNVAVIDEAAVNNCGFNERLPQMKSLIIPRTDSIVTNLENVLLTTVHADCLPVYFFDRENNAIGLAHAGWRGTAAGIAEKTLMKMRSFYGTRLENTYVYIGPGIGSCCFETGAEVYEIFKGNWDFTDEYADIRTIEEDRGEEKIKYHIDIKGINKRQLTDCGVLAHNIETDEHCTYCEEENFCSYRREGGTYMRMGAGLCLV